MMPRRPKPYLQRIIIYVPPERKELLIQLLMLKAERRLTWTDLFFEMAESYLENFRRMEMAIVEYEKRKKTLEEKVMEMEKFMQRVENRISRLEKRIEVMFRRV